MSETNNDIVKRLRGITAMDPAWCDPDCARFAKAASMAMDEAADEIERLRAELTAHQQKAANYRTRRRKQITELLRRNSDLRAEAAVLTEKLAQALRERDRTEGQRKFRAELAYLMVSEKDDLIARLQPILDAWTEASSNPKRQYLGHLDGTTSQFPGYYQELLRKHWPTLAAALDNATKEST